ncbi:EamA family transporter RarD [Marilutibacter chinensis]|uniref:EamA family transporter RarD n=1 Tax=Marilutibacter chinensis TaxID=2912247 RepID=A0ABS9HRA2_9GAMM|nr:EamA family transporter RarD [Lysobacter chinensis]MCF7221470.1 EamA family transporter RarD [Lysobacter chinensis]
MSAATGAHREHVAGLWAGIGAFVLWGLMPLFWRLLETVPSWQIVLHRIVWGALLVSAFLLWQRGRGWLRAVLAQPRTAALLALSGVLIASNWGLYIWAVNAGHVVETSLGYYINPLLNVVLGVLVLHERLNRVQWVSVALAACGVAWLTLRFGQLPWIALGLALSFGVYGLLRKQVVVDSVAGLGVESLYLLLPAMALLGWAEFQGQSGFFAFGPTPGWGWGIDALLVAGGALTALPLIGFAYAVRRVPLSVVGFLQYIAPTLQLLIGVLVFREPFDGERALGFAFIWAALLLFAGDGVLRARRQPAVAAG